MDEYLLINSLDKKLIKFPVKLCLMINIFQEVDQLELKNHLNNLIPIDLEVHSTLLLVIISYCSSHNGIEPKKIERPLGNKSLNDIVHHNWEVAFLKNLDFDMITLLISACEKIKCDSLLDLCLAYLAIWMRDNELQVLAQVLKVRNFNEEICRDVVSNYPWLMKINKDRINELEND